MSARLTQRPVEWVAVGFYVYQGKIHSVECSPRVAMNTKRIRDRVLSPAVYVLPKALGVYTSAGYYRKRVEFRDGDFYLSDGRNLREIARPPKPRALPEVASATNEEVEIEWLS